MTTSKLKLLVSWADLITPFKPLPASQDFGDAITPTAPEEESQREV